MAEKRTLIAVIADEDTTTGLLLAGIGQITPETQEKNFLFTKKVRLLRRKSLTSLITLLKRETILPSF